jgi:hypothetical protein
LQLSVLLLSKTTAKLVGIGGVLEDEGEDDVQLGNVVVGQATDAFAGTYNAVLDFQTLQNGQCN